MTKLYKLLNYFFMVTLLILIYQEASSITLREYSRRFITGAIYIQSESIRNLVNAYNVTTYYENGGILKTEVWRNGKRNGLTIVYNRDGSIAKEIKFVENYVLDYKSYKNGRIETQISENRNIIVNKGRQLNIRWDKYYELWGGNTLVGFDSKGLINYLLNFVIPEEATEVLSDITDFFNSIPGAGQSGMDDMVTCGGSTTAFKDNNMDLRQFAESPSGNNSTPGSYTVNDVIGSTVIGIVNTCASNYSNSIGGVGGGNNSRNADIDRARGALDNTIQGCKSGKRNNMFESGSGLFNPKSLQLSKEVLASLESTAWERGVAAGTEVASLSPSAIAGVMTAAVVGWSIGTLINNSSVGKAITDGIAKWQEENEEQYQAAVKEAEEDKKKSEKAATDKGKKGGTSSVGRPAPGDLDAGDPCERAERFKNYCDNTGWKDLKCQEYIRFIKGCAGDIRAIYVNPEGGSVMNVGCTQGMDPAAVRAAECKKRGMFGMPGGNDPAGLCATRKVSPPMRGPNANIINPTRGDFSIFGSSGLKFYMMGDNESSKLLSSSKPTIVIFADPDCGYCTEMATTMNTKNVQEALNGYEIMVVDVNMNPKLAQEYGVEIIPSYFVAQSGKRTEMQAGAMDEKNMVNYLTENKKGTNLKKK